MHWLLTTFLAANAALIPSPAEVAIWALEDAAIEHASGHDVSGFRYVWIHHRLENDCIDAARVIDLAPINMVLSKSANLIPSHRVNSRLLRIDLHRLGVDAVRSQKLIATWEKLRDLDHYLTASENELTVQFVEVISETPIKVQSEVIRLANAGEQLQLGAASTDPAWVTVTVNGRSAYIAANKVKPPTKSEKRSIGPQCGTAGVELAELVGSDIPIVRHDFLLRSAMHGDIFLRPLGQEGGLYYEFLQIEKGSDGETDLQAFLKVFGADFEESQKLRSDVGSILVRSNVTGRSRVLSAIRGRGGRPGSSDGVVYGTFDGKDGDDFNAARDPLENVLEFEHQASEWIAPLPNGLHAYGLFAGNVGDANQERQDFAPDDVAVDRTVPAPHGTRIVNGMCWRCHNSLEHEDGLKSAANDLATLLERGRDIVTNNEDADTIASRFSGDFQKVINRSRTDFADSVYRITRDPANKLEGLEPFEAFGLLEKIFNDYWYELVTPETALLDLGVTPVDGVSAAAELSRLVGVKDVGEAAPLVYLCSGIPVNRWQWEAVYPETILRVQETVSAVAEQMPEVEHELE